MGWILDVVFLHASLFGVLDCVHFVAVALCSNQLFIVMPMLKSSRINAAISGWVLLFVFILLLVIVFILFYCIQPTSLFHLILLENSTFLLTCIGLNTPNHVTDNVLVIMDSKPDNYYYYLLLCHYSSFVFTKETLKSLVVKYKYWIFNHGTRESFKGGTLAKSSETLCDAKQCDLTMVIKKTLRCYLWFTFFSSTQQNHSSLSL